jgi:uncharacterized protein YkwD
MKQLASALSALCCVLLTTPAVANIIDGLNDIRRNGCDRKAGVKAPLRTSRELDAVAREWSKGGRLREALARADYRGTNSASMRVEGTTDKKTILRTLQAEYCDTLIDPKFKEVGLFQRGDRVWVVVATPFAVPAVRDAATVSADVLKLVNAARSQPRKCGRTDFNAVPPLKQSAMLNQAALLHAQDMSNKNFFEHRGSDGSKVADRVSRVDYAWLTVAENIAIGAEDAESVVRGWLNSPGHCTNIMGAQYTEMGVAYVANRNSDAGIYWTQVFAKSR